MIIIQSLASPNMFFKLIFLFILLFQIYKFSANNESINVFFNANESSEARVELAYASNFSLVESTICFRFKLYWDKLKMNIVTIFTDDSEPFLNIFHQTPSYTFLQHFGQSILVKVK